MSDSVDLHSLEELQEAVDNGERAVVLFTSPSWCQPCRQMEKHWDRITHEEDDIKFYRVLELEENEWATTELGITSQPTSLVYENGEVVNTIIGARSALSFLAEIRR